MNRSNPRKSTNPVNRSDPGKSEGSVVPVSADDPQYWIAYDVHHCKVGCVLIQAALGGDVPRDLFSRYFDTETWTVDASTCALYPIRESQLAALRARSTP